MLKTEQDSVLSYQVFNDFQVIDNLINLDGVYVLLGNFGNYNEFWETDNEVQLIRFDQDLNQLWTYSPNTSQYPIEAVEVDYQNDFTIITLNVITGCHMCYNTYKAKINSQGDCISSVQISELNSSIVLGDKEINEIFKINLKEPKLP